MIKTIISITTACGLLFSANAQDNNESLFNSNELSVGLNTSYAVDRGFQDDYNLNFAGEVSYFPVKYAGLRVNLPFYSSHDVSLKEAGLSLALRVPVFKHFAPGVSVGSVYDWNRKDFDYVAGAEVETRINSKWGVFVGGQYRVQGVTRSELENGAVSLVGGVRLVF